MLGRLDNALRMHPEDMSTRQINEQLTKGVDFNDPIVIHAMKRVGLIVSDL